MNWSEQKGKTKNFLGCLEINSMFRTSVHDFFPTCHELTTWFELSRVKLYRNELKGRRRETIITSSYILVGGSSYGGFELPRVKLQ